MKRCAWANASELEMQYHDEEWGVPNHDNRMLFEMLNLEGQQAGLSWQTILNKRATYREAFFNFDPYQIAMMDEADIDALMLNAGIIRYRLKIQAIIKNAKAYVELSKKEDFSHYLWSFVNNTPCINDVKTIRDVPSQTDLSLKLSKDLKKRGFAFVGPTTVYAFMQAVGMVNDHDNACFKKGVNHVKTNN